MGGEEWRGQSSGKWGSVPRPGISVAMASLPVKEARGTYRDLQGSTETRAQGWLRPEECRAQASCTKAAASLVQQTLVPGGRSCF